MRSQALILESKAWEQAACFVTLHSSSKQALDSFLRKS